MRILPGLETESSEIIRCPTNGSEVDHVPDDIDVSASTGGGGKDVVGEGMFADEIDCGILVPSNEFGWVESVTPESVESEVLIDLVASLLVKDEEEPIAVSQIL